MVKRMPQVWTPRLGTIQSASPGSRPLRERSPTARDARVAATPTRSAITVPVLAFRATSVRRVTCVLSTIGNSTVMNRIAAGPIVTTQIAGKMQRTSGKTILTPVFAAASSARWRRLVRSVSE